MSPPLIGESTGIDLEFVGCRNNISGQVVFVTLNPGDTTWDCAAAGLSSSANTWKVDEPTALPESRKRAS